MRLRDSLGPARPSTCIRPFLLVLTVATLTFLALVGGRAVFLLQSRHANPMRLTSMLPGSSFCTEHDLALCGDPSTSSSSSTTISPLRLQSLELQLLQSNYARHSSRASAPRLGKVHVRHGDHLQAYHPAFATHHLHNLLHNYPAFVLDRPIIKGLWAKEAALLEVVLQQLALPEPARLRWLMWADADTLILNPLLPAETFLPPEPDDESESDAAAALAHIHLLYTRDWNGLNNGVFFLRVSPWSVAFLSAILAFQQYRPEIDLPFTEQSAMERVMAMEANAGRSVECPARWFNGYQGDGSHDEAQEVRPGELLVHFPGVEDKVAAMRAWGEKVRGERGRWERPLVRTHLPKEIEEFWARVRRERGGRG